MVLHPIESRNAESQGGPRPAVISAWEAVERKQKQGADEWWLIAQPDHAALAGDLAALLDTPLLPKLDEPILRAISLHDSGWARFDGGERGTGRDLEVSLRDPQVDASGKPLSFLEMTPAEFITAWHDSIQRASEVSQVGGFMVSEHFCRLARTRLESYKDGPSDLQRLNDFLAHEAKRQSELQSNELRLEEQLALLTDVLQFCDLLSLYLCCGADDPVEFPQKFSGNSVMLRRKGEMYELTPQLFGAGASLGVTARRYPIAGGVQVGTLAFLME
jgi:Protein of unknown function (DUF3891)